MCACMFSGGTVMYANLTHVSTCESQACMDEGGICGRVCANVYPMHGCVGV